MVIVIGKNIIEIMIMIVELVMEEIEKIALVMIGEVMVVLVDLVLQVEVVEAVGNLKKYIITTDIK